MSGSGYKLVWTDKPSDYEKLVNGMRHLVDVRYSLGLSLNPEGLVTDDHNFGLSGPMELRAHSLVGPEGISATVLPGR